MPRPYCPGPMPQCGNSKLIKMKNLHAFETAAAYGEEYYCCNKCGSKYNVNDTSLPSVSASAAIAAASAPSAHATVVSKQSSKQNGIWTRLATAGSPLAAKSKPSIATAPRYYFPPAHEYPQTVLPVSPPVPLLEYTSMGAVVPAPSDSPELEVLPEPTPEPEFEPEPELEPEPDLPVQPEPEQPEEPEPEPAPELEAEEPKLVDDALEPMPPTPAADPPSDELVVSDQPPEVIASPPPSTEASLVLHKSSADDRLSDEELIKLARIEELKRLEEEETQARLDELTRQEEEARYTRLQRITASPYSQHIRSPSASFVPKSPYSPRSHVSAMSHMPSPNIEGGPVVRSYASQITARLEEALMRSPFQGSVRSASQTPSSASRTPFTPARSISHTPSSASRTPFSPTHKSPHSSPPIGPDADDAALQAASGSRLFGDAPGTGSIAGSIASGMSPSTPFVKSPRYEQLELELDALMREKEREALAHRRAQKVLAARKAAMKDAIIALRDERLKLQEEVRYLEGIGATSPAMSKITWAADPSVVGDSARPSRSPSIAGQSPKPMSVVGTPKIRSATVSIRGTPRESPREVDVVRSPRSLLSPRQEAIKSPSQGLISSPRAELVKTPRHVSIKSPPVEVVQSPRVSLAPPICTCKHQTPETSADPTPPPSTPPTPKAKSLESSMVEPPPPSVSVEPAASTPIVEGVKSPRQPSAPHTPLVTSIAPSAPKPKVDLEAEARLEAMRAGRRWGRTGALFNQRAEALGVFGSPLFDS